tara:strand:+ start:1110 stop:1484 length:375 start_codon:yes stop_codon:yes gene_type:complete
MTSTYGRAGGPATQNVREYGDVTMSSASVSNNATGAILASPGADSYYLIWGATAACTGSSLGYIEQDDTGGEDILAFVVTKEGPMTTMFDLPIKLVPDVGVQVRTLAGSGGTTLGAVYYTTHLS